MKTPIHFPLYIEAPKQIPLTKEEFNHLSYFGVASLFVSYRLVIIDVNTSYKCYLTQSGDFEHLIRTNHRFKDLEWFEDTSVELSFVNIDKDSKYGSFITNKLQHLILK
jgi:hypothetical protein